MTTLERPLAAVVRQGALDGCQSLGRIIPHGDVEIMKKLMKSKSIMWALAGLGIAGAMGTNVSGADAQKPSPEVEAKMTQIIKAAYPEVVITGMKKGNEDNISVIVVGFTSKGNKMDADVAEDGTIVGTEEVADIHTFPTPAANALNKLTKGMKVDAIEIAKTYAKADKNDKAGKRVIKLAEPIIAYEADVEKDGKKGEFGVSADGTVLERPKWAKEGKSKDKN